MRLTILLVQVIPMITSYAILSHKNGKHKEIIQFLCWCKSPQVQKPF